MIWKGHIRTKVSGLPWPSKEQRLPGLLCASSGALLSCFSAEGGERENTHTLSASSDLSYIHLARPGMFYAGSRPFLHTLSCMCWRENARLPSFLNTGFAPECHQTSFKACHIPGSAAMERLTVRVQFVFTGRAVIISAAPPCSMTFHMFTECQKQGMWGSGRPFLAFCLYFTW